MSAAARPLTRTPPQGRAPAAAHRPARRAAARTSPLPPLPDSASQPASQPASRPKSRSKPPSPPPPEAAGATQRIVDAITAAIVERRLMPGTKLAEQPIADLFRVSRTLVRQALNRLSRDRLVSLEPARGAFVAMPSVDEARQVIEVRRMLEASLVRQLCARIDAAGIERLRAHLRDEADAVARGDVPRRTRLLADFHVVLARALGNEVLAQLLADLLSRSQLIALMYQSSHSAEHSSDEHAAIVDALERRDARAAVRLMDRHLTHVQSNLKLRPRAGDLSTLIEAR